MRAGARGADGGLVRNLLMSKSKFKHLDGSPGSRPKRPTNADFPRLRFAGLCLQVKCLLGLHVERTRDVPISRSFREAQTWARGCGRPMQLCMTAGCSPKEPLRKTLRVPS